MLSNQRNIFFPIFCLRTYNIFAFSFSFGALLWEILAGRPPCHWTEAECNADDESVFVFPFKDEWNVAFRNIISFCIQSLAEARPDHELLIDFLSDEKQNLNDSVGAFAGEGENENGTTSGVLLSALHKDDLQQIENDVSLIMASRHLKFISSHMFLFSLVM